MQTRSMKRKNSEKKQVSQTKKPKVEEVFPIETILQNPGFQLISRNIFKYLKLKDFSNCRLVSKSWKQFIDGDKYLDAVQVRLFVLLMEPKIKKLEIKVRHLTIELRHIGEAVRRHVEDGH